MGKSKKQKRANSDFVHIKKSKTQVGTAKKFNPFEVHVNKEKFVILGRTCKHDRGLPGVSRAKAVQKRKETLGKEYQVKNKSNRFIDRRIGRSNPFSDDLANARFAAEKISQFQTKKDRFNLNDDEILTHRGQTLEEIEQFRDNGSDDGEDHDEELDADFTKAAHFGGGDDGILDRKAAIDEMILDSKRKKAELAKEKDEIFEKTANLDKEYKNLVPLIGKLSRNDDIEKPKPDDYDKAMREMIFERRGEVADKLESEQDIARKQRERLEQLERERVERMRGDEVVDNKPKHRSADDLDDGYFAGSGDEGEEEEPTLAYDLNGETSEGKSKFDTFKELPEEEEDSEDELENEKSDKEQDKKVEELEEVEEEEEVSEDEDDSDVDNLSDLKYSDSEEEVYNKKESETDEDELKEEVEDDDDDVDDDNDDDDDDDEDVSLNKLKNLDKDQLKEKEKEKPLADNKKDMNKITLKEKIIGSKKDDSNTDFVKLELSIPFTFEMPNKYEDLLNLLSNHPPSSQGIIVERIIKCNHPKLDGNNRDKMLKLFAFLLQYLNDRFFDASSQDIVDSFIIFDKLNPHLFDLVHLNCEKTSICVIDVIKEKYAEFKKNTKNFPSLETIVYFKLVSNLFSTSDFQHNVVTPCCVFISHILSQAKVKTRQDIAIGLFICTIVLEYTYLSKRFLPAALNFLLGIVYLSIPKRPIETLKIVPPFVSTGIFNKILAIGTKPDEDIQEELLKSEDLVSTTITVDFKIRALNMSLKMIKDVIEIIEDNIGSNFIAESYIPMLERLNLDVYPSYVSESYKSCMDVLKKNFTKSLETLVPPERKPKALRLFEPRVEKVYDDKRRPKISKVREEKVKLIAKIRRETKGAVREIRKDNEFLQKIKIKKQMQSDYERREKVKRIYSEAALQQGELNEISRSKKKK